MLAPALLAAVVFFFVASLVSGLVPLSTGCRPHIIPGIGVVLLFALTFGLVGRRVPPRWIHLAAVATLWCPLGVTCWSMYVYQNQIFAAMLIVQIASAGALLHTRLVVGTLLVVNTIAIPLILRLNSPYPHILVATVLSATCFALLIHLLMRRALLHTVTHQLAEAATARRLASQLEELERSHTERARLQDQLLHSQRLEAVGTLAAGVAHDMNNVLASITTFANLITDQLVDPQARADLQQVVEQAERGATLTRSMLAFSRRGQYRRRVVSAAEVIRNVLPLLGRTLPKGVEIRDEIEVGECCLDGDPVHLGQAVVNLGLNSAHAMDGRGVLSISARIVELTSHGSLTNGNYMRLAISDTGRGMDESTRQRVFEPFFTTKPIGEGTGLGLSTVWGIVQAHQGTVEVESELGRGATFSVWLPIVSSQPAKLPRATALESKPARRVTVLIVDDERALREGTRRMVERFGLATLTAENGEQGLRVYEANADTIELVILDMGMPVMGGAECFQRLRAISTVPVLIATGYALDAEVQALVAAGAGLLEKPYRPLDLKREIVRLLGEASPIRASLTAVE